MTLEAIFAQEFTVSGNSWQISCEVSDHVINITFFIDPKFYPFQLPLVLCASPDNSATSDAALSLALATHAQQNLIGQIMVFELVQWLKSQKISQLVDQILQDMSPKQEKTEKNPKHSKGKVENIDILSELEQDLSNWKPPEPRKFSENSKADPTLLNPLLTSQYNTHRKAFLSSHTLPVLSHQKNLLKLIHDNRIVIVTGETGSGKSTQIPQIILDDFISKEKGAECHMICTQPRRLSAVSLATRVATERGDKIGMTFLICQILTVHQETLLDIKSVWKLV